MKLSSYWLDTAPTFSAESALTSDETFDVLIIGGGFTGLSTALACSKRGAKVAICEAATVGSEASGRNGGQCNNGTAQDYAGLISSVGSEKAREYYLAYNAAVDSVEKLIEEQNIDCNFKRVGKIKLAAKPEHLAKLEQAHKAISQEVDPDAIVLDAQQLKSEICSPAFFGGLVTPNGAQLHVGKLVIGLAQSCVKNGVKIYQHNPVTQLTRKSDLGWAVSTPNGLIKAKQVVLANGGSGPGPFSWFRRRIVPVGSFIITTEQLSDSIIDELMPNRRSFVTTKNIGNYFRVTPDNRLLFGGRARFAMSNPKSDEKSGVVLHNALSEIFPQLAQCKIDYCWGGTVDMSADRLPKAGEHDGLYYAMGYSGHGVQMAVHMGEIMADMIDGKNQSNPWFDSKWKAVPGHFGKPWFLPVVGLYYKLQDQLH